jgi:hypothetical protein
VKKGVLIVNLSDLIFSGLFLLFFLAILIMRFYTHGCEVTVAAHLRKRYPHLWDEFKLTEPSLLSFGLGEINSATRTELRHRRPDDEVLISLLHDYERALQIGWVIGISWILIILVVVIREV